MQTSRAVEGVSVFAAVYDLVARVFLEGPRVLAPEVMPPVDALLDALGEVDRVLREDLRTLLRGDPEARQAEFETALLLPVPGRAVPACASVYLDGGSLYGRSALKVAELYEREGLAVSGALGDGQPLPPDHVGCEAAFLALIESMEDARGDALRAARLAREFIANHVLRWLPQFSTALRDAGHLWLRGFAELFGDLARLDLARLDRELRRDPHHNGSEGMDRDVP